MMNLKTSPLVGAGAMALATVVAMAAMPLPVALAVAGLCGLGVTLLTQGRRFDEGERLVYRPVYVRTRSVHRRVRSFED